MNWPPRAKIAVRHTSEVFDSQVALLLPDADGRIGHPRGAILPGSLRGADLSVAQWVFDHGQNAGLGTDTLPGNDDVIVASPCSGHGFKFASVIGEILADLATGDRSAFALDMFRLSRF